MKNKNISRRKLIQTTGLLGVIATQEPAKWSKPIVDTVLLPVHAATSAAEETSSASVNCSMSDLVGEWDWFYDGETVSGDTDDLYINGLTRSGGVVWSISGADFTYTLTEGDDVFEVKGVMDATCTSMSGSYSGDGEGTITGKKV